MPISHPPVVVHDAEQVVEGGSGASRHESTLLIPIREGYIREVEAVEREVDDHVLLACPSPLCDVPLERHDEDVRKLSDLLDLEGGHKVLAHGAAVVLPRRGNDDGVRICVEVDSGEIKFSHVLTSSFSGLQCAVMRSVRGTLSDGGVAAAIANRDGPSMMSTKGIFLFSQITKKKASVPIVSGSLRRRIDSVRNDIRVGSLVIRKPHC